MASGISLSVITPSGTIYKNDNVSAVTARTWSGEITVLPNHAPIFTRLEHDEVRIQHDDKEDNITIFQGFLHLDPEGNMTILADNARRSEELNVEAIRKAKEAAEKALENKDKLSATEILRAETAIRRAIMELRVAQRRTKQGL